MHQGLRILMTNNTLANRAGSEIYIRDLALALMRRGHSPIAYSTTLGEVAEELRKATIPVVSNLNEINVVPDIIHGQHHLETMTAMLHFNKAPAIFICHGWEPWEESPPVFPRIHRYIAVDDLCRERIFTTHGIRSDQVEVLYNFVDLSRFSQRRALPLRAKTALVFSNYVSEGIQLHNIRKACAHMGISKVDVAGLRSGNAIAQPEDILPEYDLVFAKARCALEALACGCSVIVADTSGLGGIVTTKNMHRLRALNFGVRTMQDNTLSEERVIQELEKYDAEDSNLVSSWIRKNADLEKAVDQWLEIYKKILDDEKNTKGTDRQEESRAAASYLRFLSKEIKNSTHALSTKNLTENELRQQKTLNDDLQKQFNLLADELDLSASQLAAIKSSRTWRFFSSYRKIRSWMK